MEDREHEEMKKTIASYALGTLPEDEISVARAHLLTCDECAAEAEELARVGSALATGVDPRPLPDGFADRVLERVAEERPEPLAERAAPQGPARRFGFGWFGAFAAAALVLVLGVIAINVLGSDELSRAERVAALMDSDDGLVLSGAGEAAGVVTREDGATVFAAHGLQDVPEGTTYQLWMLRGDCTAGGTDCEQVSFGTFEAPDGLAIVETERSTEGFTGAAVTVEPDGGSPSPTTDPVLAPA